MLNYGKVIQHPYDRFNIFYNILATYALNSKNIVKCVNSYDRFNIFYNILAIKDISNVEGLSFCNNILIPGVNFTHKILVKFIPGDN